jgi:hypothetical protein
MIELLFVRNTNQLFVGKVGAARTNSNRKPFFSLLFCFLKIFFSLLFLSLKNTGYFVGHSIALKSTNNVILDVVDRFPLYSP